MDVTYKAKMKEILSKYNSFYGESDSRRPHSDNRRYFLIKKIDYHFSKKNYFV